MATTLQSIIDVPAEWETHHSIRVLVTDGRSHVARTLAEWKARENAEYRKIIKVMGRVADCRRVQDQRLVRADAKKTGIYEMRANQGKARVLFFYDDDPGETVICVCTYWKGQGDQAAAFERSAWISEFWRSEKRGSRSPR